MQRKTATFTPEGSGGPRSRGQRKPTGSALGAHLRVARLRAGLTLRELGQMLHPTRHPSTISNWERGKRVPRRASLAQLADLFEWGTADVEAVAADQTAVAGGQLIAPDPVRTTDTTAAGPGRRLSRLEALLNGLRAIYAEAFEDGHLAAYCEAQKEILLLRKQLASERDRARRQRDQLVELQRRAEMSRLAERSS